METDPQLYIAYLCIYILSAYLPHVSRTCCCQLTYVHMCNCVYCACAACPHRPGYQVSADMSPMTFAADSTQYYPSMEAAQSACDADSTCTCFSSAGLVVLGPVPDLAIEVGFCAYCKGERVGGSVDG